MITRRITILGCGSSGGVPRADGDWGACDPDEPKNRRSRCGLLVQQWQGGAGEPKQSTSVLIDTAPDLREQLIAAKVSHVDAILYTHDHADQTHGIDDVRALVVRMRRRIRVWMDPPTRERLMRRFGYCFVGEGGYPPILDDVGTLSDGGAVVVDGPGGDIAFTAIDQDHGGTRSLGFRFGDAAYSNDVVALPQQSLARLEGVSLWIVDALRVNPHPTHAHLARSLEWIDALKPKRAVLTNMHVDMDYRSLVATLPAGVEPAYDGMAIEYAL